MMRFWVSVATMGLVGSLAFVLAAEWNLDRKTSIDVSAALPRDVFGSIARTLGCDFNIPDEIRTPVTMRLDNVTIRTALNALSESLGCRWRIEGNTLFVETAGTAKPGEAKTVGGKAGVQGGVVGGVPGGVKGGVPGGVSGGVVGGVPGGVGGVNFKERLERRTPAGFRFENVPLQTVLQALGKTADLDIKVQEPEFNEPITIDLSDRTVLSALNAIRDKVGPDKPVVFAATVDGSDKKVLLKIGPRRK